MYRWEKIDGKYETTLCIVGRCPLHGFLCPGLSFYKSQQAEFYIRSVTYRNYYVAVPQKTKNNGNMYCTFTLRTLKAQWARRKHRQEGKRLFGKCSVTRIGTGEELASFKLFDNWARERVWKAELISLTVGQQKNMSLGH